MKKKLKTLNFYLKKNKITKLWNCQMNWDLLSISIFLQPRPLGWVPVLISIPVLIAINLELGIKIDPQVRFET
jgi:hypothetical protein